MIQTITLSDFRTAFHQCGRGNQFSYEALELIFDYIEEYEGSTGKQVELDPIAICCEWSEDTPEDIATAYNIDLEGVDEDEIKQEVIDHLDYHTQVAGVTNAGTIVYVQF